MFKGNPKIVLIASANTLFAKGLEKLLMGVSQDEVNVAGIATNLQETMELMDHLAPDIVVIDFDDHTLNREAFLEHFISGVQPMRVLLVSLQTTGMITIYDRHSLTPVKVEDWLEIFR